MFLRSQARIWETEDVNEEGGVNERGSRRKLCSGNGMLRHQLALSPELA